MAEFTLPETQYAQSGEISIAYQVMGDGPVDLILVPGIISHIEFMHELPGYTDFLRRLSTFARVITFDKRGQGLSDRLIEAQSLEQRMDDVRAIMDAVGSEEAALIGFSQGGAMSALFAATYPDRVSHLVIFGGVARFADQYPLPASVLDQILTERLKAWGKGQLMKTVIAREFENPVAVAQFGKLEKLACSPGALKTIALLDREIDVSHVLPTVRVPTLVLHRETDAQVAVALGRRFAAGIPGAKYIEYPSGDHAFWTGDTDAILGDIEEFVTGTRGSSSAEQERLLATVLFTDVVDSTRQAAQLGDQRWKQLLRQHHDIAGQLIAKHRGTFIKSTGDGVLATFDGPARAVRCALAMSAGAKQTGLPVRAGLHTGEIEISGKDIGGISVHAAARVMAQADPNEVLVSRVVTDLVAGAGLKFSERGSYELKGLSGRWDLFAATS